MTAPPLSLNSQRKSEAEKYRQLNLEATQKGVISLTAQKVCRLEELHQLQLNHEFEPQLSNKVIAQLANKRIEKLQDRIAKGLPPCESTRFTTWQWIPGKNGEAGHYLWTGTNKPEGVLGSFSWTPEWTTRENPYQNPEGSPLSSERGL